MDVLNSLAGLRPNRRHVLTVGMFDGVHVGHQKILSKVREVARSEEGIPVVAMFDPPPIHVLRPELAATPSRLMSPAEKVRALAACGIEKCIFIPFTREFAAMEAEAYVSDVLCGTIGMSAIVVGYDHVFGKNRSGGTHTLRALSDRLDFTVHEIGGFSLGGEPVSSTRIRQAVASGDMETAAGLLSRPYEISGEVIHGDARGRKIGFPTANLKPDDPAKLMPAHGVYAVSVDVAGSRRAGMANLGVRPTFDGQNEVLEVHLFAFDRDIYGETARVKFMKHIRAERKFTGVDALTAQLEQDKQTSLDFFQLDPMGQIQE